MQHVGLITRVGLPPFPQPTHLDRAVQRLGRLVALAKEIPLSAAVPAQVWQHARRTSPGLVKEARNSTAVWLRVGWAEPNLASWPSSARIDQLSAEQSLLDELGVSASGLLSVAWDPTLITTLASHRIRYLVVETSRLGPITQTGLVSRFSDTLELVPASPLNAISEGATPNSTEPYAGSFQAVLVPHIAQAVERFHGENTVLTTWAEHRVRFPPQPMATPNSHNSDWGSAFTSKSGLSREQNIVRSKLIRFYTGAQPATSTPRHTDLLSTQHHQIFTPATPPQLCHTAQGALIGVQQELDREQRGENWAQITWLDWDQDGTEEIEVQQPQLGYVYDPIEPGRLLYLDYKPNRWPVTGFSPSDGFPTGISLALAEYPHHPPAPFPLTSATPVEEQKGKVCFQLHSSDSAQGLRVVVETNQNRLTIGYRQSPEGKKITEPIGPFIPLFFGGDTVRYRVDGSPWQQVTRTVQRNGHRVRFQTPTSQARMDLSTPSQITISFYPEQGIGVWVKWRTSSQHHYQFQMELSHDPTNHPSATD